ncbi:hypothetical protein [Ensifer canadensis]
MDADRKAFLKELRQAYKGHVDILAMSRVFLTDLDRKIFESDLRRQFENSGIELYEGKDGRHGYWDGQFAVQLAQIFALAMTGSVQQLIAPVMFVVCPTYCDLKRAGKLETEGFQLVVSIADALIAAQTQVPVPVTQISVYAVKHHALEGWCQCG